MVLEAYVVTWSLFFFFFLVVRALQQQGCLKRLLKQIFIGQKSQYTIACESENMTDKDNHNNKETTVPKVCLHLH